MQTLYAAFPSSDPETPPSQKPSNKDLRLMVSNIYEVVRHSGVFSNYKLRDFLEVLVEMHKGTEDTETLDHVRNLNSVLQTNLKTYADSMSLDKFNLSECIEYMGKVLTTNEGQDDNNTKTGTFVILVIKWFNIFLSTPRIDFLKYLNLFLGKLIDLMGEKNTEVHMSLEKCLKDIRTRF
jgi:hypothetical protein